MAGIFKKFFHRDPPFDEKAEAKRLLQTLPVCSSHVVIASPKYSEYYRCEVVMPARALVSFADRTRESTFGGSYASRTAREALPEWLLAASPMDARTSYMPVEFAEVVRSYVLDFIHDGTASVYCQDCKSFIEKIIETQSNPKAYGPRIEPTSEYTASWECPAGHRLYQEHLQFRFHCTPDV
jgi:hypothetical protein